MNPFSIQCTTCQRSLRVTSPEAIGKILSCPKCGSMVMVEAPPGMIVEPHRGSAAIPAASAGPTSAASAKSASSSSATFGQQRTPVSGAPAKPTPHVDEDLASAMEALAGGILPLSKSGSGPVTPPGTASKTPAGTAGGAAAKWAHPTPPAAKASETKNPQTKSSGVQPSPGNAPEQSNPSAGSRAPAGNTAAGQASIKPTSPQREDRTSQWKHPPKAPADAAKQPAAPIRQQPAAAKQPTAGEAKPPVSEKTDRKSAVKAALAMAAITLPGADAAASPANSEPPATAPAGHDAWPRWFLPGAAGTVLVGIVIIALRMLLHGGSEPAPNIASAPTANSTSEPAANTTASTNSARAPADNAATAKPNDAMTANNTTSNAGASHPTVAEQSPPAVEAIATKPEPDQKTSVANSDGDHPAVDSIVPSNDVPPLVPEPKSTQIVSDPPPDIAPARDPASSGNPISPRTSMDVPPPVPSPDVPSMAASANPKTNGIAPVADSAGAFPNAGSFANPNPAATAGAASNQTGAANQDSAANPGAAVNAVAAGNPQPTVQRTLTRMPPRMVNVNARLADPAPALEVRGIALADYLALVSDFSAIPITLDADAVLELGQSPAVAVKAKLNNTTVADTLEAALDPLGMSYQARDGQLLIGFPPQEKMRPVKYLVTDLVGDDPKALANFGDLVRRFVAPASWQQAGGRASMVAGNGTLVIEQTEAAHADILTLCEKLRVARGMPQKSKFDPARFVLATRADKAHEMLVKPLRANFSAPQPLSNVVRWIHQSTGAIVLIDHAALAGQGISAESECTAAVVDQPLAELLEKLVGSIDLTWRAIDDRTVEITSKSAAAARMDVEFYPVARQAADATAAQAVIRKIKAKVAPELWGDKPNQATIVFDPPSKTLLIRAPQRVQAEVEAQLNSFGK